MPKLIEKTQPMNRESVMKRRMAAEERLRQLRERRRASASQEATPPKIAATDRPAVKKAEDAMVVEPTGFEPTTLAEIAEKEPHEVGLALAELSEIFADVSDVFKGLATDTAHMKDNLDLTEPPKTASLRERVHFRRNYARTLRRLASEDPEELGNAISAIYTQLDEAAEGIEAMAERFGLPLHTDDTMDETNQAEERPSEEPTPEPAPVVASERKATVTKSAATTVDVGTRTIHWHNYDIRYTADDFVNPDSFEATWGTGPNTQEIANLESSVGQPKAFVIHNQGYVQAIVFSEYYQYSEQDALDEAVDSGKLDGLLLDEKELEDYKVGEDSEGNPEYENVIFLGNASEPFSSESLDMFVIPAALFKYDPVIVAAKQDDEEFNEPEDEGHTASSKKANGEEPKTAAGEADSKYCSQCGPFHEDPDKPGYCERHGKKIRKPESKKAAGGMDDFTTAYFEAALWSSTDQSDESGGEPLDSNYSFTDIAPETREKMMADCAAFQDKYGDLITDDNLKHQRGGEWGVEGMAGHDFWLTRNGHGAGFWDGDWEKPAADQLTKGSKEFGEYDLYIGDDGQIWGQ